MGKPKKGKKGRGEEEFDDDVDIIDPIAAAEQEEKDDKPASAAGKKGKKGRKKKDDDWEDDVAAELAALSMEANKGMKEEGKEEEILPVKKEKKKTRGKKKAADSDEEEDAPSGGPAPVSAFQMLDIEEPEQDDDDDDDDNETPEKKENNKTNETEKASNKQKKSKKEKRKQKQADEDDDLDAILAELEKPVEKPAKSKKDKTKQAETSENQTEPVKSEQTDNDAQKISDDLPEGKKEENISKSKDVEDAMEGDEENEEEGHTVKTAAQKKKEKRERQKKQREMEKMQAAKKGKKEASPEVVEEKKEEAAAKPEMETAAEEGADRESDDEEGDKKSKKDKKKKKDKDAKDAKGKKKPASAQLKAMQEALAKLKEEEERLKREEEEKERKREEALRLREEQKRLEEERKQKKKQKEKERKERLKQEGKLLTAKQKQDRQRAMQLLQTMKAQGIEVPEKTENQKPRYMSLKDKRKKQQQQQEESTSKREKTPDEGATPPTTPETPSDLSEKFPPSAPKEEKEEEDLKDAWDISSEEEEEEETKPAAEAPASKPVVKEEVKEEEEEESEEDDETDTTESEDEESSEDEDLDASEKAYARIQKRHEDAEAKRSTDHLRAPVVCVLGHVDTGKTKILDKLRRTNVQDGEAGGITQQIGATNVPGDAIKEATKMCKEFSKQEFKIPGLLIIDTPGHESFSNLRTRGSSLCDIAILVVDIMHGLEPQTLESIQLLRDRKTPFVVALNKIDRLFQWKSNPHSDVVNTLKKQNLNTKDEFDERVKEVILQFAEQSLNACLFYDNKNPREYVSLVPTSAHSGDGMGNLLALICELTQTMLAKRLAYSEELQATVMEVKAIQGLGTTMDVILVNGKLHEGETIVVPGTEGPIVTQIRGLLMPQPMKELRVKNAYEKTKVLKAAQGVKIIAKDLEKALAGLPMYAPQHQDEVEYYKEELSRALKDALNSIKLSERGVFVQASTLGSLEALLEFLRTSKIPYAGINIGPVHKKDIMRASVMLDHDPQWAVILAFDVKVEREAQELADSVGVQIFTADIIYHLFDQFMAHREELKKRKQEEYKHIAVFPCKIRVLPQYIFNSRDPIVCGVSIEAGFLREGTPLCVPSKEFVELGRVTSLEINHKPVDIARKGQEVCIKIEPTGGDAPKMYGRHFDHDDMLVSKISRESIDAVKNYFRDFMTKTDWQLVMELKKVFDIL